MDRDFEDLRKNVEKAKEAAGEALAEIDAALEELERVGDGIKELQENQKED